MKASILAHGLMQNLVVTTDATGGYFVIAGGRRLNALRELQKDGKLPDDHAVPCQVVTHDHALEMSLAENTVRLAMHPADEYEAYARLIEGGDSIDNIAERFGMSARHVEQRLTLGKVAPELLEAYRAEKLTLECLMAFTITDDRAKQLEVYGALEEWHTAHNIREMLTGEMAEAKSKLARFVGLDAYYAAGGISRTDLFEDDVYLENAGLLNRLAGEKLDGIRQELEAEGWKWVDVSPDCDWSVIHGCNRIHPQPAAVPQELLDEREQAENELEEIQQALEDTESDALIEALEEAEARLAGIEDKLESFAAYDPEQMAIAGCYVSIGRDGELSVEKGLVRRADAKHLASDGGAGQPKPKGMPDTLRRDLEGYRLQAAQAEIARNRLVALDLLVFNAACGVLARRPVQGGPDVQFTRHSATPAVQKEQTEAGDALEAIGQGLPLAWARHGTEAEQYRAFLDLSDSAKLDLLAWCVAASLKPQLATGKEATAYELALSLTDAGMAGYWRPTRANYLGRISRDQLLALGRELLGEQWSQARSRDKKGELADSLERAFAEPERYAHNAVQLDKLKHWLPQGMAFCTADAGQAVATDGEMAA